MTELRETSPQGHFRGGAAYLSGPFDWQGGSDHDAAYEYQAEALITADGDVRLYIGGPGDVSSLYSGAGLPDISDPVISMQFSGRLAPEDDTGSGSGIVIGQACGDTGPKRFCDAPGVGELYFTAQAPTLLRVTKTEDEENRSEELWRLDLARWSTYYHLPASSSGRDYTGPTGLYSEQLASFAEADDVIISVDAGGRLFFQSPNSGCIGNGNLTPYGDAKSYVFDVDLLIENCKPNYSSMNGLFEGLATESQNGAWDYDSWLIMFLSTPAGSSPQAAVTMMAASI